jgi:hypothetical protein
VFELDRIQKLHKKIAFYKLIVKNMNWIEFKVRSKKVFELDRIQKLHKKIAFYKLIVKNMNVSI